MAGTPVPGCVPRGVTLLECNLLRPPGLIDEQSAEEPGAGDDPGTKTGIAANRAKDRTGSGTGRLKPILVVVGRRRRRRRGGLGGGPTRMGRRTSPSSFATLPEAQFCGVIVPNSPFISLSGPAVK